MSGNNKETTLHSASSDTSIPPSGETGDISLPNDNLQVQNDTATTDVTNEGNEGNQHCEEEEEFYGETYTINENVFESLKSMGFSECAIKKSIINGCINQHTCVEWITMHAGHPSLEEPIDPTEARVLIKKTTVLTQEQREMKVNELKAKIAQNKEKEQKEELERIRKAEKNRIESAKAALALREEREKEERMAVYENRRKEKEADARAKEAIQIKLLIDKLVRKGKTPEEAEVMAKQEMKEKKEKKLSEVSASCVTLHKGSNENVNIKQQCVGVATAAQREEGPVRPWDVASILHKGNEHNNANAVDEEDKNVTLNNIMPSLEGFQTVYEQMKQAAASTQQFDAAVSTLRIIISNIIASPLDMKKRNIKTTSNTFRQNVAPVKYSLSFLKLAGFSVAQTADGDQKVLVMNVVIMRRLMAAMSVL